MRLPGKKPPLRHHFVSSVPFQNSKCDSALSFPGQVFPVSLPLRNIVPQVPKSQADLALCGSSWGLPEHESPQSLAAKNASPALFPSSLRPSWKPWRKEHFWFSLSLAAPVWAVPASHTGRTGMSQPLLKLQPPCPHHPRAALSFGFLL